MADKKYVLQLEVNASGAITNADQVAKKLETIDKVANTTTGGLAGLKKELRAVENELAGLDSGSERFAELSTQAGQLKDRMKDVREAVGNQAGPAVEVLSNNFQKLRGDLMNLDFEGASTALRGIGGSIKNISFKEIIGGIKNFGSALANVGKALLTNPIFLIAAAVAAAALAINSAFESIKAEQQKVVDLANANAQAERDKLTALQEGDATLKLQGKSEKEILKLKLEQIDAAIQAQEIAIETQKNVTKTQVEQAKRNKEIVSGILQFITIPIQALLFGVDQLTEKLNSIGVISDETFASLGNLRDKFNDKVSSLAFDPDEIQAEGDAALKEQEKTLQQLKNQRDSFRLNLRNIEKQEAEQRIAEAKAVEDAIMAIEKNSYNTRLIELQRFYDDLRKKAGNNKDVILKIDAAEKNERAVLDSQEQTRIANETEQITAIKSKGISDQGIVLSAGLMQQQATLVQANAQELQLTQEQIDYLNSLDERRKNQRIETTQAGLETIQNLTTLFAGKTKASQKRAFEIGKKVQIAAALIDTYKSATAAYASQILPGDPSSPVRGAIAAAAAVTAGLVQVNNIRKQTFDGGGGSAGGGGGSASAGAGAGSAGSAPAFSVTNNQNIGERPNQPAVKTYVLASEVTSNQEATEKIESRTRIG